MTAARRPAVIGLAGGPGAGKSAVAAALARRGCVVIDADAVAKAALDTPAVRARLAAWWGKGVFDKAGRVDRGAVAGIVFADPVQRARLEALVHPIVKSGRSGVIEQAQRDGMVGVVIDAPLLFEAGSDEGCDAVIFVDSPRPQRLARVKDERGWDEAELDRREAAQLPLEEKERRSTHVLNNRGDLAELDRRTGEVLEQILRGRG